MINFIDKGAGLTDWLASQNIILEQRDGVWISNVSDDIINPLIVSYNPWTTEKAKMFAKIDEDFQKHTNALTAGWPEGEIKTWSIQQEEAKKYIADNSTATPMLSIIAATRGLTVLELATRVNRDATAFAQASAYYVGLRHVARQKIQAFPNEGEYHRLPDLWSIKFKE